MELTGVKLKDIDKALDIVDVAKKHLKEQGIDQWQNGYPDYECIKGDIINKTGFFLREKGEVLGYLCIDFKEEPAYNDLNGKWNSSEKYVVMHRLAFSENARGRNLSDTVFGLIEEMSKKQGVYYFRVDTDEENKKMQHILKKNGFSYCGTIWFDNSEKIAFDKKINK